ncbi:restriction endonuclease subunit S [Aequorivita nionensis]|uniref:restriction endonuclease subunit S n=1 Tax=Aequorivita nionensis TaxID=1287690 RepID=UPI003965A2DB
MRERKETPIGFIPNDWELGKFSEDLRIQGRIGWKGYKTTDLVDEGPIVIGGTEIKSSIFLRLDNVSHLSRNKFVESPEIMLKEGDVLLVTRGNLGEVGYYHEHYGEGTINPSVIILNEFIGNPKFLFYYLISKNGNHQVLSLTSGSSIPAIYQSEVKQMRYPRPSLSEQNNIVNLLFSIDKKITLLRQQNATLEELAQLLFKRWFVDGAKKEWELKELSEITDVGIGRTPPRKDPQWFSTLEDDVKWISIKDMGNDGVFLFETSEYLTRKAIEKFNIPVIPKNTVILSFKMTLGRIGITSEDMLSNEAIAHFKFTDETPITKEYLYLYLKNYRFENLGSTSSIVTSINSSMIKSMKIHVPDKKTMTEFQDVSENIFNKIRINQKEIQTLTQLRDTLLPKLMSGEVRVKK